MIEPIRKYGNALVITESGGHFLLENAALEIEILVHKECVITQIPEQVLREILYNCIDSANQGDTYIINEQGERINGY